MNPLDLPSVPLSARSQLPECPGIYCCMKGGEFVYIGRSSNLWRRWQYPHHKESQVSRLGNISIYFLAADGWPPRALANLERDLIRQFSPYLNGRSIPKGADIQSWMEHARFARECRLALSADTASPLTDEDELYF